MARTPTVYWDSCVWIGLINQEPDKYPRVLGVLNRARAGKVQIITSTFTLAEVVKRKCSGVTVEMSDTEDDPFAELLQQEFVTIVNADWDASVMARSLYRQFNGDGLKKPQDALHLATAVIENVDEMHTFDGSDLLKLNGKVKRSDGMTLSIQKPPEPEPEYVQPSLLGDAEPIS
ncbi:MAG: type II toxin-antitoxin system VapC family toxin [Phenylobacterium sp.]